MRPGALATRLLVKQCVFKKITIKKKEKGERERRERKKAMGLNPKSLVCLRASTKIVARLSF